MLKPMVFCALAMWASLGMAADDQQSRAEPVTDSVKLTADTLQPGSPARDATFVVYYFHGNKRCMTCRKIEALAERSLRGSFSSSLADSTLQWRVVNFQDDGNAPFAKAYKLFTQTLIISRRAGEKEIGWQNLDQIWTLVHDEGRFLAYVRDEVSAFMKAEAE